MHKNSPFLYYLALFILVLASFKYYNQNKKSSPPKNLENIKKEEKTITLDFGNITQSIIEAKNKINEGQERIKNEISLNQSHASYIKNKNFTNKVNLCFSSYKLHFKLFSEDGEKLYEKQNFTLEVVKEHTYFYNFLHNILALTSQDEIVEVFIPKLDLLPEFFTQTEVNKQKSGLLKLLFIKSDDKNSILVNDIKLNSSIISQDGKRRGNPQFVCNDKVKISYTIYDAKQNVLSSEVKTLTLNGNGDKFEKILEYIVLSSKGKTIDASFSSYNFDETIKDQTLTIKGIIELKNDER